jgi:phage shock protein PspC (stress-responsive transcriptional regulator)
MKKIININLSGRVIPIEDSAYEKLQGYIESLRKYFSNEEGRDEIINDIESRIAELMNEKVRKGADRITDADVDEIIASMGRPEDFDADDTPTDQQTASQQKESSYTNYSEKKGRRRLYRDTSDKVLGGVCSGIANYLNVDPAIIRILFAIVTFGGFGFGILVYGLLWMVLPSQDLEGFSGKRLYRNPDDKVIGGVAGGLAAYFKREAWVVRLIFASPILLSAFTSIFSATIYHYNFHLVPNILFGSLSGTFIFIYIILWIVLPEASSQYEKMEMRGEKVDVNTIRQNVKEGIQQTKERLKDWGSEVKESAQSFSNKAKDFANTRGKTFAAEAGEAARRTSNGIGHVIGVIFKSFFLFVAGSIALGLFVALIALLFTGIAWWPVNHFLWTSKWQQLYAWGTLIFFLGVPLIAFIIWIIRRIIRVRSRSGYLGWTFGGLWVIGWICATLFAASISRDLREYEHSDTPITITQPQKGKMVVKVSEPELEYTGSFAWINDESTGWDLTEDTLKLSAIRFNIELSDDSDFHVIMKKYSAGTTRGEARQRAEKIIYNVSYKDSVLDLGSGYAIDKNSKYRGQKIEMEIQIPANRKIRFDASVEDKLNPMNVRIQKYHGRNRRGVNIEINESDFFPWSVNTDYIMGKDGVLRNPDKAKNAPDDDYRYKQSTDTLDLDKSIEQKEKELNDLKEKKKKQQRTTGFIQNDFDSRKTEAIVITPSPIFSLVNTFN